MEYVVKLHLHELVLLPSSRSNFSAATGASTPRSVRSDAGVSDSNGCTFLSFGRFDGSGAELVSPNSSSPRFVTTFLKYFGGKTPAWPSVRITPFLLRKKVMPSVIKEAR